MLHQAPNLVTIIWNTKKTIRKMINFYWIRNENNEVLNQNLTTFFDYLYRLLIIGGSGSGTNHYLISLNISIHIRYTFTQKAKINQSTIFNQKKVNKQV